MRLFVGIGLTDDVRAAVVEEQARVARSLGDAADRLRWTPPERMHLTLAFIGHVPGDVAARVNAAFRHRVEVAPFEVVFGGLGMFPRCGGPRVLWLGIVEGQRALQMLYGQVASRLTTAHAPFDTKPFHPHLTLGRWRESRAPDRRGVTLIDAPPHGPCRLGPLAVTNVTLYDSR